MIRDIIDRIKPGMFAVPTLLSYRARLKVGPRLRECCRPGQVEVVSNDSKKKSPNLYAESWKLSRTVLEDMLGKFPEAIDAAI